VAEFKEAYGQDFDEQIKNLAVEYEQIADGNTEAYFTLLTLAEGTVFRVPSPFFAASKANLS
jgi:hypothetical protein